jgi:hypothetical protein
MQVLRRWTQHISSLEVKGFDELIQLHHRTASAESAKAYVRQIFSFAA